MHGASQGAQAPTRKWLASNTQGLMPPHTHAMEWLIFARRDWVPKKFRRLRRGSSRAKKVGRGGRAKKVPSQFFFVTSPRLGVKCGPTPGRRFGAHRPHTRSMPSKRRGSQDGLAPHATLMADLGYFCQKAHKTCPWPPKTIKKRIKGRQLSNHRWLDNCRRAPLHPTIMCGEPRPNPKIG